MLDSDNIDLTIQDLLVSKIQGLQNENAMLVRYTINSKSKILEKYKEELTFKCLNKFKILEDIYNTRIDIFNDYQAYQRKKIFKGVEYIVSFLGLERRRAKFVGVYRVLNVKDVEADDDRQFDENDRYYYSLEKVNLPELDGKKIILWGDNCRQWRQCFSTNPKMIIN